jgi:hypothetical protein
VEQSEFAPPPEPVRWLEIWDRLADKESRRSYVQAELQRILAEGRPPLYAVATLPLAEQRDVARSVLRAIKPVILVRLAPGAIPPPLDPHGYPLPPSKAGKVAVLKVRTNGADRGADEDGGRLWTAVGRQAALRPNSPRPLYGSVEVGHEPTPLAFDDAYTLFEKWGYGVLPERFKGAYVLKQRQPDGSQKVVSVPRDRWLLIEAEGESLLPRPAPKNDPAPGDRRGRAA